MTRKLSVNVIRNLITNLVGNAHVSRRKNRLYVAAGFLLLAAIIGITSQQEVRSQGNPNTINAKIVNTAAEPVPTALSSSANTIKLDQSGSNNVVQARQLNAWSVGITGTPTVQIGNTATSPAQVHEVENAARQPFQTSVSLPLSVGQTSGQLAAVSEPGQSQS